ncbi:hypothetical protein BC831DRAFT_437859 [Entophlyctis helioformis]|nr:hypothetical protein BC831DRAFT_437859 [Entophlyctis helioformis]
MHTIAVQVLLDGVSATARAVPVDVALTPWTRASDVVDAALERARRSQPPAPSAPSQQAPFALYETELVRPPQPPQGIRRKSNDDMQRRYIRALDPDELPLVILANWRLQPSAANYTFCIKSRDGDEVSAFAALRQEQCSPSLSTGSTGGCRQSTGKRPTSSTISGGGTALNARLCWQGCRSCVAVLDTNL